MQDRQVWDIMLKKLKNIYTHVYLQRSVNEKI